MVIAIAAGARKALIGTLITASLMQAALAVVGAYCVQRVFDTLLSPAGGAHAQPTMIDGLFASFGALLSQSNDPARVEMAAIAGLFAAAALCAAMLEMYRAWAGEKLGLSYVAEVRASLFERIVSASPALLNQKRQGGLLLPFVGDLTAIKKWVSDGLVRLISASLTCLLLLCVLAVENPLLAAAASVIVFAAASAAIWLSGPLNRAISETRARRGAVANFVSSSIRAASTIQAFNRLGREQQRLGRRNDALTIAGLRLAGLSGAMTAIIHLAATALVGATLVIGVVEVQRGGMSIGLVAAAISIAGLLAGAVRDLGISFELSRRAQVSFAKIAAKLEIEPAVRADPVRRRLRNADGGVRLESVTVEGLFKRIKAEANKGAVVNIAGESGVGKSILLAIAARLRDPDKGKVRLNGRDLRRFSPQSVRRHIGVASAATPLMRGTIAMNLRYRAPDASAEEVARVVDICNVGPILDRLALREQTRLGEGAPELSKSEVQRLLIARAMLGAPAVLILDEVDTHLDIDTATRIAAALKSYSGVVLMTAASPVLRGVADATWRIARGRLAIEEAVPERSLKIVGPAEPAEPAPALTRAQP